MPSQMSVDIFRLDGKNALVTGSHKGLGVAIAVGLAEAGANVFCHGRDPSPGSAPGKIQAQGRKTGYFAADLADSKACVALIDETTRQLGSLDILINNAGIIRRAPATTYSAQDWDEVIGVNLTAVFRLSQLVGQQMLRASKRGKIVNIASVLSFQGGILVPAYSAAKGGVALLTKALSNEWASKGINVNAIAPGYMATDNTAALRNDPERSRQILERIPAGRWGAPEDLVGAAVFLCSTASDYVHGHLLVVDGGWLSR
jgi:2-dehydro-3-deoxy-D-gluconate 5-dehydrogenase